MREPGVEDATRRTRLANERTYLAWWRTGLTSLAVGIGIGKLLPEHTSAASWPYEVVGAAFGVLGIARVHGADPRELVGDDAHARAGAAREDSQVGVTRGHHARRREHALGAQHRPQHRHAHGHAVGHLLQHARLRAVGDLVGFGISHPCTVFDKWQLLPMLDEQWRVVGAAHTFF